MNPLYFAFCANPVLTIIALAAAVVCGPDWIKERLK
jgi:hypothetical protein